MTDLDMPHYHQNSRKLVERSIPYFRMYFHKCLDFLLNALETLNGERCRKRNENVTSWRLDCRIDLKNFSGKLRLY